MSSRLAAASNVIRFGMAADAHLRIDQLPRHAEHFGQFVEAMKAWRPDFVVDLGDFNIRSDEPRGTTAARHEGQLRGLARHWDIYQSIGCPIYTVLGNHDAGWIKGADERITAADLYDVRHLGEDITKDEFVAGTGMPGRYYSFDVEGWHFIALDPHNHREHDSPAPGHDGVEGATVIDQTQVRWVEQDLETHRDQRKIVLSHVELHYTPVKGSGQGGDVPFASVGKDTRFVDNGWQLRELFAADGNVVACFFGHMHHSRHVIYDGTHYLTLAGLFMDGSYAKVTLSADKLRIDGVGSQRNFDLPIGQ